MLGSYLGLATDAGVTIVQIQAPRGYYDRSVPEHPSCKALTRAVKALQGI